MSNIKHDRDPRNNYFPIKLPQCVLDEAARISGLEDRTQSTIIYYMILRGMKQYQKDGKLYLEDNEQRFLLERPAKQARRKRG